MTKPNNINADAGEDIRSRRKSALIKLAIVLVLAIIVWLFSSIAWFSKNKNASGSGMSVTTATMKFDIATKGAEIRNQSVINEQASQYVEGVSGNKADTNNETDTYYTGDSLLLRFTPAEDDPSTTDVDESITPDISPGSDGELSLYVIPKVDEAFDVNVSLNVVPFAEIDKYETVSEVVTDANGDEVYENGEPVTTMVTQKNGTEIIELTNENAFRTAATAAGNAQAASEARQYIAAANYLKGHILFFGGRGNTSTGNEDTWYYYTTPYTTRTISDKTIAAGNKGKAVQIPIYWMWTNTLGQIALQTDNNKLRSGIPVVQETTVNLTDETVTDKEMMLAYLNANKSSIFSGTEIITDEMIYAADEVQNFDTLSKQYNAADYEIGTRIAYFMIDVTVS